MAQYIGVNGVARNIASSYVGVGGVARKAKAGYIGVDGVARKFLSSGPKYLFGVENVLPSNAVYWTVGSATTTQIPTSNFQTPTQTPISQQFNSYIILYSDAYNKWTGLKDIDTAGYKYLKITCRVGCSNSSAYGYCGLFNGADSLANDPVTQTRLTLNNITTVTFDVSAYDKVAVAVRTYGAGKSYSHIAYIGTIMLTNEA